MYYFNDKNTSPVKIALDRLNYNSLIRGFRSYLSGGWPSQDQSESLMIEALDELEIKANKEGFEAFVVYNLIIEMVYRLDRHTSGNVLVEDVKEMMDSFLQEEGLKEAIVFALKTTQAIELSPRFDELSAAAEYLAGQIENLDEKELLEVDYTLDGKHYQGRVIRHSYRLYEELVGTDYYSESNDRLYELEFHQQGLQVWELANLILADMIEFVYKQKAKYMYPLAVKVFERNEYASVYPQMMENEYFIRRQIETYFQKDMLSLILQIEAGVSVRALDAFRKPHTYKTDVFTGGDTALGVSGIARLYIQAKQGLEMRYVADYPIDEAAKDFLDENRDVLERLDGIIFNEFSYTYDLEDTLKMIDGFEELMLRGGDNFIIRKSGLELKVQIEDYQQLDEKRKLIRISFDDNFYTYLVFNEDDYIEKSVDYLVRLAIAEKYGVSYKTTENLYERLLSRID